MGPLHSGAPGLWPPCPPHCYTTVYILHQNSHTKGTSLGIVDSPRNDFYRPKLCCLSCTLITSTHPKYRARGSFLGLANPLCRNSEIFHGCTARHIDSRLLFQTRSKSAQNKCPEGRVVLVTKKNKTLCEPLRRLPRIFVRMRSVVPKLHSMFYPNPFRFGEIMMENLFRDPQSKNNRGPRLLRAYNEYDMRPRLQWKRN